MKLSTEILYEELKQTFDKIIVKQNHNAYLDYPMLYDDNPSEKGVCYISDDEVTYINSGSILICTKKMQTELDCDCIIIENAVSVHSVFNRVIKVFQKYHDWERELQEILNSTGSIQKMISSSIDIFGNLLASNDSSYLSVFLDCPNYSENQFPQRVSKDYMSNIFKDFQWNPNSKEPVLTVADGYAKNIALNIFDDDRFLGSISVSETHQPLHSYDGYLLTILAKYIRQAILLYGYYDLRGDNSIEKTLGNLLVRKELNFEEKLNLESHMNNYPTGYYQTIVINDSNIFNDDYYRFALRSLSAQHTTMFIHVNSLPIVILVHLGSEEATSNNLHEILDACSLQLGVSDYFTNLFEIRTYYLQAKLALDTAYGLNKKQSVTYFNHYSLDYILNQIDDPEVLYPFGFRKLIEYDKTSRVSYVDTLDAYLQNSSNALQAAKALHITRNSFLSRLDRLISILDMDIEDYTNQLYLSICIRLEKNKKYL